MRMSCNGCRVLRKGCSEDCTIRPCLQWIKNPDSQANATVFLAKFYGRAGLINLLNAGSDHLRPAIFRSLLYEACGRIVNPVYGSAGLLWSGSWQLCHAAVEAVLNGVEITQVPSESAVGSMSPPLKACDIRHIYKADDSSASSRDLHKVKKTRSRFKRSAPRPKPTSELVAVSSRTVGPESRMSLDGDSGETDSMSVQTVEASLVRYEARADDSDVELDLTLGFEPKPILRLEGASDMKGKEQINGRKGRTC